MSPMWCLYKTKVLDNNAGGPGLASFETWVSGTCPAGVPRSRPSFGLGRKFLLVGRNAPPNQKKVEWGTQAARSGMVRQCISPFSLQKSPLPSFKNVAHPGSYERILQRPALIRKIRKRSVLSVRRRYDYLLSVCVNDEIRIMCDDDHLSPLLCRPEVSGKKRIDRLAV